MNCGNNAKLYKRGNDVKEFLLKNKYISVILMIIYDIVAIQAASFFALYFRFDFSIADIPKEFINNVIGYALINTITTLIIFALFGLYRYLWRYIGSLEVLLGLVACLLSSACYMAVNARNWNVPRSFYGFYPCFLFFLVMGMRCSYRVGTALVARLKTKQSGLGKRVMIVGAGEAGAAIIKEYQLSKYLNQVVVCVIDDDSAKKRRYVHGCKIVGGRYNIVDAAQKYAVDEIVIAIPSLKQSELRKIIEICQETACKIRILPGMYQLIKEEVSVSRLKEIDIEDLLGRDSVNVNLKEIAEYVKDKIVLVTGGGGSIGSELCRQIAQRKPKELIIVDIYENNAYDIQQELKTNFPELKLVVLIASVRNTNRMKMIFNKYRPDIVYHAAAHKHVPLMEDSPNEAIKNNVFGTLKTARAAAQSGTKRFVLISTDKAVNPTNIMGASKRMCEMIIQMLNRHYETEFVAVRFGNVLGSNGSVIPLFRKQIASGGPVTVTHPDIIRYFMTIPEAVSLVLQAGAYAKGGEIFIFDMGEPVKIADLAKNMIRLSGYIPDEDIEIKYTGLRPGEKLYEELLMEEEGLQDTDNHLIHIGRPIEFDEDKFLEQLDRLEKAVKDDEQDVRSIVKEIVPTYNPKKI